MSILLYGCTTCKLTKHMEKKLDRNYKRMLHVVLNKSWKQHPTEQWLHAHLPLISKIIQVRWTRRAGHYWRSKDKFISDVLWALTHGCASVGWIARTYSYYFCTDTGCNLEDLTEVMDDRDGWRERESGKSVLVARLDDDVSLDF